ncbi:Deoxyuridine 5'-triphosphate nucleotidohydrolase [compost metagenome]
MNKASWPVWRGIIDHGYTGNIRVTICNLSLLPRRIKAGDRIAQMIFVPFVNMKIQEINDYDEFVDVVKDESNSDRLDSGFGDSGKN